MDIEPSAEPGYDLGRLVDKAQSDLLASDSLFSTDQAIQWIEENSGHMVPANQVKAALLVHPLIVAADVAGRLWQRGTNSGRPKRNFIGMGRR